MDSKQILKRLYTDYTKKYLPKILLSIFFSLLLAGSTSAVAYLLDPAIKELFIKQSSSLVYVIPFNNSCFYCKRYFTLFSKSHYDWCCRRS